MGTQTHDWVAYMHGESILTAPSSSSQMHMLQLSSFGSNPSSYTCMQGQAIKYMGHVRLDGMIMQVSWCDTPSLIEECPSKGNKYS